jgi:F-type H+-transporting ATPase subunit gamma
LHVKENINEGKTFTFEKADPSYNEIKDVAAELAQLFTSGEVGKVHIAYNSFISALEFESKITQALPMSLSEEEKAKLTEEFTCDFKYEPSVDVILDELIPEAFNTMMFTCILDAIASEHGSRMTAMENALRTVKK